MRIITGKYKGRHFDIPRTFKARPTTDFAKENIFNVLNAYIDFDDTTALDLFAGTGSITLELLSRGCKQVVSIEKDRDHHRFIQQCVKKLEGHGSAGAWERESENRDKPLESQAGSPNLAPSLSRPLAPTLIRGDVFRFLKSCKQQFDFIFADPPYALKELAQIPDLIFRESDGAMERGSENRDKPLESQAGSPNLVPSLSRPLAPSLLKPDGIFVLEHGKDYDFSEHPHFVEHRQYGSVNFSLFK